MVSLVGVYLACDVFVFGFGLLFRYYRSGLKDLFIGIDADMFVYRESACDSA